MLDRNILHVTQLDCHKHKHDYVNNNNDRQH